ncbi:glycosyltransferase [Halovivax limisalsi]|uniref:glycosyltransferase n=1 Tax=Halovivax limisalsi TaxID=1453760 RepID=UPI001FFD6B67|nr:glycosyltransferase [Halovivax limisalsi]
MVILGLDRGILEEMGFEPENICNITNGISPNIRESHEDISLPGYNLTYVGHVTESRGLHEMLDLVENAKSEMPEVRLNLVGTDLEDQAWIQGEISSRGLSHHTRIVGQVAHEAALGYLDASDVCICILSDEVRNYRYSYPIKILEFMYFGNLIIASPLPGIESLIGGEEFMVSFEDDDYVRTLMKHNNNEEYRERIERLSREKSKSYHWNSINTEIVSSINELNEGE